MKNVTCFISQSDKRVFKVEVDSKGVGQECLDKVSHYSMTSYNLPEIKMHAF